MPTTRFVKLYWILYGSIVYFLKLFLGLFIKQGMEEDWILGHVTGHKVVTLKTLKSMSSSLHLKQDIIVYYSLHLKQDII